MYLKMLACNCLNVVIEFERDFEKATKDSLNLSEKEKCEDFFKQDYFYKMKVRNISKTYATLVDTKYVDSWMISHCINCNVRTHAIHMSNEIPFVLVNVELLNSEAIGNTKLSDIFSRVFQIVVNPNGIGYDNKPFNAYHKKDVEDFIKYISDLVSGYIQSEKIEIEERISRFSKGQYESFNLLKDRIAKEHDTLVRLVLCLEPDMVAENDNIIAQQESSKKSRMPFSVTHGSNQSSGPSSPSITPVSPKRSKNSFSSKLMEADGDDLIFDFENDEYGHSKVESVALESLDDNLSEASEEDPIPDEIEEEGIKIAQKRHGSLTVAKSCPVDIPNFTAFAKNKSQLVGSEDSEDLTPAEKVDIAASIKALANSVHGDAVFGELPRPRFSTQI